MRTLKSVRLSIRAIAALSAAAAAIYLAATAPAEAEVVQAKVKASLPILTVADFFPGSGSLGSTPIFRAPDLGQVGIVDAHVVAAAAHAAGYTSARAGTVGRIEVERMAIRVDDELVSSLIERSIRDRLSIPDENAVEIRLSRIFEPLFADPAVARPYRIAALRASPTNPSFEVALEVIANQGPVRLTVTGMAIEMTDVVIANRSLRQGEVLSEEDLALLAVPRSRAPAAQASKQALLGKEMTRSLGRGTALQVTDVQEPTLVRRGDTVMIVYRRDSLVLSVVGEALSSGARGEAVRVLNTKTRRNLEGRIIDAGTVEVGQVRAQVASVEIAQ